MSCVKVTTFTDWYSSTRVLVFSSRFRKVVDSKVPAYMLELCDMSMILCTLYKDVNVTDTRDEIYDKSDPNCDENMRNIIFNRI